MLLFVVFPAIAMALVFTVMVIRAKNPAHSVLFFIPVPRNTSGLPPLLGLDFFAMIFLVVHLETLGRLLYTNYSVPFPVSSLILLVAIIGAIVLTQYRTTTVERQDVFYHNAIDFWRILGKIREKKPIFLRGIFILLPHKRTHT